MDITHQSAAPPDSHKDSKKHKIWLGTYLILSLACFGVWLLLKLRVFEVFGTYRETLQKISLAASVSFVVLILARWLESFSEKKAHSKAAHYNLVRLIRLVAVLLIAGVFISFLFEHWYTAAVSLGLISLILGFALQTPISSFVGWIYIVLRNPYRVGDRVQVATFKGDVVEIGYLDTTLWEFGGDYLSNDVPSGRLIRFPNSLVFQNQIYNYSWRRFPFIWNEIPFHVAYESDLEFITKTLRETTAAVLGPDMPQQVERLRELVADTAIDDIDIKEYPFVQFRTNANTWVEALVVYLVPPRRSGAVRTEIVKKAIAALLKEPDKVMFPKGNSR